MSSIPFYDSAGRRTGMVAELRELVRYRDLLTLLVSQITKNRYKRSALGVLWTLLNPLISMAVLTIAFSTVFDNPPIIFPGVVFALRSTRPFCRYASFHAI